jgi:hypothetical protein
VVVVEDRRVSEDRRERKSDILRTQDSRRPPSQRQERTGP